MNVPPNVQLSPINLTAELQKVALANALTQDQHADLRTLILDAAAAIGMDGSGRDGLVGYLKYAAASFPKQYMALLSKVLPLQIDSKSTINVIEHVNIVSVPSDRYMPSTAFSPDTNPKDINHEASPILDTEDSSSVQTIEDLLNNPTPVDIGLGKVLDPPKAG
jgi:hypothetical protein